MTDRLFVDVRRFTAPPGRPIGTEGFDRTVRRLGPAVRRRLARCFGVPVHEPETGLAAYLSPPGW